MACLRCQYLLAGAKVGGKSLAFRSEKSLLHLHDVNESQLSQWYYIRYAGVKFRYGDLLTVYKSKQNDAGIDIIPKYLKLDQKEHVR